jgi:hypothetical protein
MVVRTLFPAVVAAALVLGTGANVALASHLIDVPPGVLIEAKLDERISSHDAKVGQTFVFETTSEAHVGDITVPVGTLGHGRVEVAEATVGSRPGKLTLALVSIDLPDGRDIPVGFAPGSAVGGVGKHVKGAIIPIPLPIGVVFVGGGSKPSDVVFPQGTLFTAQTGPASTPLPAASP